MSRHVFYLIPIIFFRISYSQVSEPKEVLFCQSPADKVSTRIYQDQSQTEQTESSKSSLYLQFNTSGLYPSLTDWKNQFHLSDGSRPSVTCIVFGAEGGWVVNRYIQESIGYEFFFTSKATTVYAAGAVEPTGDQINSTFFYGSIRGSLPLESIQNLSLFGSLDVGSISVTEVMENYYGQDFNKTGSTTAYRFMLGAQYFMTENWSIMLVTGYFLGKVNNVTGNGQTWPNFSLDLSGFVLRFAVNYHFQLF